MMEERRPRRKQGEISGQSGCLASKRLPVLKGMSDLERKMVEDNLVETFKKNKLEISKAINTPSPFLEILRDHSVISEEMYQCAQKKYQKLVPICKGSICTYSILMQLEKKFSSKILAALFHPTNLQEYPLLVQIQKQFRDEPLDESTSEVNMGSPLQRSSLDESAWIISTPQSSVQVPLDQSTPESNVSSPVQRSSLDESISARDVQVPLDQSTPESNVGSPVQRSSFDESISFSDVQVPLDQSTPESNVSSPVQRSSLDESISARDVQVPLNQSTPESNVGSPVQRSSLDESTSVSDVQVPLDQSTPESNVGSPVQRSSLDESTSVSDVQVPPDQSPPESNAGLLSKEAAWMRVHLSEMSKDQRLRAARDLRSRLIQWIHFEDEKTEGQSG
uniref:Nuclear autoantigen Sp-100-like isoform X8 n=1 Tax=Phascolarctos cinereus TaxID=38626 RepID=A0A6P5JIX6_PHACI|nr:nuclear autoantigen Sp-100-like isoform X8 [Phascolarctos cinereus]